MKLLEEGKIAFVKVGKRRGIKFEDLLKFRKQMKEQQKQNIVDIVNADEEIGLYDS